MNNGWRRIVSTAVAILLATSTLSLCAPTAVASEGHCKPARSVKAGCHHCPPKDVVDCCASSVPQPSSIPQNTPPQESTRTSSQAASSQADAVVAVAALQPPAIARLVRGAPLHGYRSIDLPTLNAVFLI